MGGIKRKRVAKFSDFGHIKGARFLGGKLVLITNRKSYMSFRLVLKSVTLNDLKRRNGPYFALLYRICVCCRRKTIIRPIPPCQNLLFILYDHINMICVIIQQVFGQNKRRQ